MNQASHYVDLLDWLIGPVESVQAYTATLARNIQVEDTGVVSIRWRTGALGSMNVTMLTYPKNLEGSITIIGEKGTVRVGGVAVNKIEHWEFADADPDDASRRAGELRDDLGLRLRPSALLRQRHQVPPRRGRARHRRPRGPALARDPHRHLHLRAGRPAGRPAARGLTVAALGLPRAAASSFLPFALPDLGEEEMEAVVRVLRSGWITTGPEVQAFEREFAALPAACATRSR